jgi:hypothetical protein
MQPIPAEVDVLIVVGRELPGFYEFLKPRQEAKGGTAVVLDRRIGPVDGPPPLPLPVERRTATPAAAAALFSVIGFVVLHRAGPHWVV